MSTSTQPGATRAAQDRAAAPARGHRTRRVRWSREAVIGLALIAPAFLFYALFVLVPLASTVQYSFYDWNGVTTATWAGLDNYVRIFTDAQLLGPIVNALTLILYFSIIPVTVGLVAAALIRKLGGSRLASVSRTVLFLPQVIPLVAAGIMWTWLLAADGAINQFLTAIGLGGITRAWLGDFDTALPAVGVIGAWVSLGLCMLLLLAGMTKIDPALYEAVRIDGAGPVREFFTVTLPAVRQELGVAVLITVIGALRSFDIIYISTQGGPGRSTMVPGLEIYYLAFFERQVGQASALAVVLTVLVLVVVLPLNKLTRGKDES